MRTGESQLLVLARRIVGFKAITCGRKAKAVGLVGESGLVKVANPEPSPI